MKTIAVVEDNPDNRLLVQVMLDPLYAVAEYETGGDALAGLRQHKPDLVLLDISLPGMDGTEVLRQIRADAALRDLPVIALTANAMSHQVETYFAAGMNGFVAKPISVPLLFAAIADALSAKGDPSQPASSVLDHPRVGLVGGSTCRATAASSSPTVRP